MAVARPSRPVWAVYEVGQNLKRQLIDRAAQLWEVNAGRSLMPMEFSKHDGHSLTFKELAAKIGELGAPIMASADRGT